MIRALVSIRVLVEQIEERGGPMRELTLEELRSVSAGVTDTGTGQPKPAGATN